MGQGKSEQPGETGAIGTKHHFYHDTQSRRSLSTAIISALAEVNGVDVTSLGFALHDFVDTDALDALFAPKLDGTPREGVRIEFSLPNHSITVYSDGHIVITDRQESASP